MPHLKDLKSSDIQDADKGGSLSLCLVQRLIDPHHQPAEHPLVRGFGQSLDGKLSLLLRLRLLHIVPANLQNKYSNVILRYRDNHPAELSTSLNRKTCKNSDGVVSHYKWKFVLVPVSLSKLYIFFNGFSVKVVFILLNQR